MKEHFTSATPGYCVVELEGQKVALRCERHQGLPPHTRVDTGSAPDDVYLALPDGDLPATPAVTPTGVLERLTKLADQQGNVDFALHRDDAGEWVGTIIAGQEAPDSPMAGGASYGMGMDLVIMVDEMLSEWGL